MDIAVTGSSGLIGTALSHHLTGQGHRVVPVVRRRPRAGEDAIVWDPDAGTIDAAGLEGLDAVVHLAGAGIGDKRWSAERKRVILDSRRRSTTLLATTLVGLVRPPRVLVSGSAIGFYGDRGDEVVDEASPAGTGFLAEVCVAWEAAAQPVVGAGIRLVNIRTGQVLTPTGGALPKQLPLFKFYLGGRMGSGRQWWSWITLDDEVGAITWLLDHDDVAGPVNLVAPTPVTNAEFARTLGHALGRPSLLPVPAFGPRLVVGSELADQLLFASQRVNPSVLTAAGYPFAHPHLDEALTSMLADDARQAS